MLSRTLSVLFFPVALCAQSLYPRIEITEVSVDPVGPNAGQQVVELAVGNAPLDTVGFVLFAGGTAVPFPSLVLPTGQLLRAHLGSAGTNTVTDLFFPTCPLLGVDDSLAVFASNQPQNPAELVDFVAWGTPPNAVAATAVLAGRWPNTLLGATLPTQEGATLANRTFTRTSSSWVGPGAWYVDTTPTLGTPNDPGMTWNLGQGCVIPANAPVLTLNDVFDGGPWTGATHDLVFGNLPQPAGALLLVFGLQATGAIDLTSVGMPNCYSHVSLDSVVLVAHSQGIGRFSYAIPNVLGLVGTEYYLQALVPDAAAGNALRALVTNAAIARIGSR